MIPFSRTLALLFSGLALVLLLSCCRKNAPQQVPETSSAAKVAQTSLVAPAPNTVIKIGDSVRIELASLRNDLHIDSVSVRSGKQTRTFTGGSLQRFYWSSQDHRVGQTILQVTVYYNDSLRDTHSASMVILSDLVPKKQNYRIINKYPHDSHAYTQGLIYDNGVLYESTGLEGQSSLRIVEISTGKPIKMVSLAPQYFGEGIAFYKDQVYQVTYRSQVGFVYDKRTLQQIRSFDYQIKEGWGLTTDGQNLIMTDGSAVLYFIEPEFYTQVDKVEVFDHKGMVTSLNEIEFARGKVLANVYGESYIVIIDPLTGKVTGKIDLEALMPEGSKGDYSKVLNGIAWNKENGHLYVTGKNWPVLYEIELVPSL